MHKFLMWLTSFLKGREISIDNEPYLERYYLGALFGKSLFIHRFMGDDPERGLHNHPWSWAFSLMLAGQYTETFAHELTDNLKIVDARIKRAPTCNYISGTRLHRITVEDWNVGNTWTLFTHGKRDREWGFLEYETYVNDISADTGIIINEVFHKADTPAERTENELWYKRKDTIRGAEMRAQRETFNELRKK